MNVDISVIIPIYNEEEVIPELYQRLKNAVLEISSNYELIFVNDGSRDNSLYKLIKLASEDANVFYINFSRNFVTIQVPTPECKQWFLTRQKEIVGFS